MDVASKGAQGELQVRGPSSMIGYLNNPLATAESMDDGWIRTGDKGFIQDQKLYLTGRIKVGNLTRQKKVASLAADICRNLSKYVAGRSRQPRLKRPF